jgi:hypothetical protein
VLSSPFLRHSTSSLSMSISCACLHALCVSERLSCQQATPFPLGVLVGGEDARLVAALAACSPGMGQLIYSI